MKKALKNNIFGAFAVVAILGLVLTFAPDHASAQYNGGYNNNNYGGYNRGSYYGGGYGYGYNNYYNNYYPSAPMHRATPTVQVVYPNGYFYNYYIPTSRYLPNVGYNYGYNRNCSYYSPCM